MNYLWWIGKYFEVMYNTFFGSLFQKKYSREWDAVVQRIISEGEFSYFHKNDGITYSAVIKLHESEYEIWLANKWYAYGYNYSELNYSQQRRPSIKTMIKLEKWLEDYQ